MENFGFFRGGLGLGEPFEIIRRATLKRPSPEKVSSKFCCVIFLTLSKGTGS